MSDEDILKVQSYLEGSLTEEEVKQLQILMETSPEFSKSVIFQSKVLSLIEATKKADRKEQMLSDFRSITKDRPTKSLHFQKRTTWYAVAASFAILIIISIWQMLDNNSSKKTFSSYYKPYDGMVVMRGQGQLLINGITAYNSGEYENALQLLISAPKTGIADGQLNLLIGNCYLSLDNADSSLVWFRKITDQENSLIKSNRDWYIALALLHKDEIDQSRETLKRIVISKEYYAQKASDLLSEDIYQ